MARKKATSRPNLPQEALDRARREASGDFAYTPAVSQVQARPRADAAKAQAATTARTTVEDLAREYAYVIADLRNMGLLAAGLFAALIVISLVF